MSLFLTIVGVLLLIPSLSGVAFGAYMSTHSGTRDSGTLFALLWVPALAAAIGILLKDPVTFIVGAICFLVAGVTVYLSGRVTSKPTARRTISETPPPAQRTTRENQKQNRYRRAAS